jgi:2-dehydro-3-deoxygalactonokinase
MNHYFLSCDWGTSAFRLRLIHTSEQQIISELTAKDGIARTYDAWKATRNPTADRLLFFKEILKKHVKTLENQSKKLLKGMDIVISGMASASIGMYELSYTSMPFPIDGSRACIHTIKADDDFPHTIWLISGVRTEDDVMRGEETQLIGLVQLLNLTAKKKYIVLLPGTHSKHILVQNKHIVRFHTYMTGELFNILSQHSILKDSIDLFDMQNYGHQEQMTFKKGVFEAQKTGILNQLFSVRTNQLFQKYTKKENAFYLSGLLIGSELQPLLKQRNTQLILSSGSNLYEFYKWAIDALDLTQRTTIISPETIDNAVVVGQIQILKSIKR